MQFDDFDRIAQTAKEQAALPPAPPPKPERTAWGAVFRGIAGGAAQLMGQAEEATTIRGMDRRRPDDDPIQQERDRSERRRADIAQQALDYERGLRPDAATATTAENVVYGLSRSLTKAIGATATAGPVAGATVFGASEAAGTFDDLAREGVDRSTAGKAAAVSGVAGAAGVLLPLVGSTLWRTAALYVAGGPGAFMAQQQATRTILEQANYDEIAKRYDPLDPLGLSLSALVPLPFAAMGAARNIRGARKQVAVAPDQAPRAERQPGNTDTAPQAAAASEAAIPSEALDAALVHNLTLARAQTDAVPPAAGVAEMFRGPVTENPNFKAWFGDSKVVREDGAPMVVYHGTAGDFDSFSADALGSNTAAASARSAFFFSSDPRIASGYALGSEISRANLAANMRGEPMVPDTRMSVGNIKDGGWSEANVMPVYVALKNPLVVDFKGIAYRERKFSSIIEDARIAGHDGVLLKNVDDSFHTGYSGFSDVYAVFNPTQIKSAIGNSGRFDPNSSSLTDPVPDAPIAQNSRPEEAKPPAQVEQARAAAADLQAGGKPIEQFLAERGDIPDDVRNLLLGLYEAGTDGARADRMLADYARTAAAQRLRPTVDVAADVVEAARTGKTVTPEPAAEATKAMKPESAAAKMSADRLSTLEAESPDMVVRVEEDGRQVTLREELQRVRREAAEGTDAELGALDADLVRVAAECFLATGAA